MTQKKLLLGTAQWGWTVSRNEAFRILDAWLAAGHRAVDAATNYPINKNSADFRAAEKILLEYIRAHGLHDLDITMKIGSLDNTRSPETNLAPSFVRMIAEEYARLFGKNLRVLMLHWDNRDEIAAIRSTLEALANVQTELGLQPGISGVKYPEAYIQANKDLNLHFDIQLKHNVLHSDLLRYAGFSEATNRRFAYGINAGGLKLEGPYPSGSTFLARGGDPEKAATILEKIRAELPRWHTAFVRPPVRTMNHIGLISAGLHPQINGLVLGVASAAQLRETLDFWRNLDTFDYSDVFASIKKLTG
ncbi:MAG: aldo/keto reductase [Saprospiraceae bacterium]|jgi:aryl-alcohol dehydrogenase-like predicted oxidoreductase|nr:aldo/keto reductase [Saprospiraceae bacterium]